MDGVERSVSFTHVTPGLGTDGFTGSVNPWVYGGMADVTMEGVHWRFCEGRSLKSIKE